ncbi:VC0807 family protein [Streptomyces sp. NPDC002845]
MAAFHSARAIPIKDSLLIGIIGLGILLTLVMARPFAYYMGRRFATDGTEASRAWWASLWRYDDFRRTWRTITVVWGVTFVVEAAIRVLLTYTLSTSIMVSVSSSGPFTVLVGLVFWTIRYSRRKQAQAEQAQAERAQGSVEAHGATGLAGNGTVS